MARRSSSRAIPFPIAGPREALDAILAAVTDADPARPGQPRHQPDGPDPARRRARRRARPARDRHARRRRARARDGAGRPRRASAPPTGPATATSGCAGRRARACCGSGPIAATGSTRSSCRTARTPTLARTDPLPPRVRLGRHDRPDRLPGTPRGDRLDGHGRGARWRRLAVAHGRQPRARARGRATCLPRRSGSTHRRPMRCSARWRRCRLAGRRRRQPRPRRSARQLGAEDGIQVPIGGLAGPGRAGRRGRRGGSSSASPPSATTSPPTTSGWPRRSSVESGLRRAPPGRSCRCPSRRRGAAPSGAATTGTGLVSPVRNGSTVPRYMSPVGGERHPQDDARRPFGDDRRRTGRRSEVRDDRDAADRGVRIERRRSGCGTPSHALPPWP